MIAIISSVVIIASRKMSIYVAFYVQKRSGQDRPLLSENQIQPAAEVAPTSIRAFRRVESVQSLAAVPNPQAVNCARRHLKVGIARADRRF